MSGMITLAFEGAEMRVSDRGGALYFVASDVCRALGLAHVATTLRKLDDDEKGVQIVHTPGGHQSVAMVSEPGVYKLIGRSKRPEARRFDRWVRHEVLPQIRRTGSYAPAPGLDLRDPGQLALVAAQLATLVREGQEEIARLRPVAGAYDRLAEAGGSMSITEAAKALKVPPRQLGTFLRDRGWVYRKAEGRSWLAYQRFIDAGLLEHRVIELGVGAGAEPTLPGRVVTQVLVTPRGLTRLALLLQPAEPPAAGLPLAPTSAPAAGSQVH